MYDLKRLFAVARAGLRDLAPALRQAFNDDPGDDRLGLVYGPRPRLRIVAIAVAGVAAGLLLEQLPPLQSLTALVNGPAVVIGVVHAALFRRYLFRSGAAREEDFPWLAASLAPAAALLMLETAVATAAGGAGRGGPSTFGIGIALVSLTHGLGVVAALTIAVAALCFHGNWLIALRDLAVRLFVFRFMVWLTALIVLEIGIVGPILAAVFGDLFDLHLPAWLPVLMDEISYAALMAVIYLAVIGGTWTVCRRSFAELLAAGEVDVLAAVEALAKKPPKPPADEQAQGGQPAGRRRRGGRRQEPPAV